jgi:uncharacterized protein
MPAASRIFPGPPPGAELVPCQYVSPDGLIEGDPQEREYLYLTSPDGTFSVGVWEAQPYSFTMEAGWAGEWRVDKPFMKYFAVSTPRR